MAATHHLQVREPSPSTAEIFQSYSAEVHDAHYGPGNALGKLAFERASQYYDAHHDSLTGVYNRRTIDEILLTQEPPRALLIADTDNVKRVNDKLGHARGDALIVATCDALVASLRPNDIVARTGGDEFTVLLSPNRRTETSKLSPEELIEATQERIYEKMQEFLDLPENADIRAVLGVGISVGGAVWREGMTLQDLINAADAKMYVNKEASKASQK